MQGERSQNPFTLPGCIRAYNPESKKEDFLVRFSSRPIQRAKRMGRGAELECAYLVPDVLQHPRHVWRGLRWDDDPILSGGVEGWLCYCKIPPYSYGKDGKRNPPRPNRVFIVVVDTDLIVYNWWWVPCDPDDPECPDGYNKGRFREPLL